MMNKPYPKLESVLSSIEYPKLLYQILKGNDYAVAIAKAINKKRSNVAQQLYVLKKYNLVRKTYRNKRQHYEITRNGSNFLVLKKRYEDELKRVGIMGELS